MKYKRPKPLNQVTRAPQKLTLWQHLVLARPVIITLVVVLVLSAGAFWLVWTRLEWRDNDIAGRPLLHGQGIVVRRIVTTPTGRRNWNAGEATFTFQFRINGHLANLIAPNDETSVFTNVGDTVQVSYRIGRSGTYYPIDWQPPVKR